MSPLNRRNVLSIVSIPLIAIASFMVSKHAISAGPLITAQQADAMLGIFDETDRPAPVDYGTGPGVMSKAQITPAESTSSSSQIPAGGVTASVSAVFVSAVAWPIIPIHLVLLPDGRMMNYGTDQSGQQGAQLIYDVWDPTLGTANNAHLVLPNPTASDLFCSSQSVMLSGAVLISGGDLTVNG